MAVRVGSRHESAALNGVSHFLEHMLFRGTAAYPTAYDFNLAVEELGGTLHAATHADFTSYQLTVPPEHVDRGLAIVAELFGPPALRNLDLEKKIVREEILEGIDEDGRDVDPDDLVHRAMFGSHPLGLKIAGTEEALERFDEPTLRAWHARHYVARNASIAVAGALDPEAVHDAVQRHFGSIAPGQRQRPAPVGRPLRGPRLGYVQSTGSQTDVRIAFAGPGEGDPLEWATDLMVRVLDDGMSTRLFRHIVEDMGLAYEVFGTFDPYEDVGLLVVGAAIEHGKTAALVSAVLDLLRALRDEGVEPRELSKAKTRATFELRRMMDDGEALAGMLAVDRLFDRDLGLAEIRERIEAVSPQDVAAAARRTLNAEHLQVVCVGMLPEGIERETRRIVQAFV